MSEWKAAFFGTLLAVGVGTTLGGCGGGDLCEDVIKGVYPRCWTPVAGEQAPTVGACKAAKDTCSDDEVGKVNGYVSCISAYGECDSGRIGNTQAATDCLAELEGVSSGCKLAALFPPP